MKVIDMLVKDFLLWAPLIVVAFFNAAVRELLFVKYFNELSAHQLSTLTLILLSSLYVFLVVPYLDIQNSRQALLVGLFWVLLTVLFEFSLGRITKKPWSVLLKDYNIMSGHIWPIFLFCLLFLPYWCYLLRK